MAKRVNNFTMSDFYCTQCGKKTFSLPRQASAQREPGHLKNLYCIFCKQTNNCVEIRPFSKYTIDDFLFELEQKNFTIEGQRLIPYDKLERSIGDNE